MANRNARKHGVYSADSIALRREVSAFTRESRRLVEVRSDHFLPGSAGPKPSEEAYAPISERCEHWPWH